MSAVQTLVYVLNRHSATLLSQKLVIFGGRKTATYLNDLHVLDLGKTDLFFFSYVNVCISIYSVTTL